ncbi:hypothetical protein FHX08_005464 [Rhizobium sp. BK529]|nr:hypothetical protein [Rhizobium sp. BK529]
MANQLLVLGLTQKATGLVVQGSVALASGGGAYLTSEIKTSFKGYYSGSPGQQSSLTRSFVQFDGVGDTANARRAIGGHPASLVSGVCMLKKPSSPYADEKGCVPLGKIINYAGGRSNGCTTWSPAEAPHCFPPFRTTPQPSTSIQSPATSRPFPRPRVRPNRASSGMLSALSRSARRGSGAGTSSNCLSPNTRKTILLLRTSPSRSAIRRRIDTSARIPQSCLAGIRYIL